jgi:hypothetical protein
MLTFNFLEGRLTTSIFSNTPLPVTLVGLRLRECYRTNPLLYFFFFFLTAYGQLLGAIVMIGENLTDNRATCK